MGHSVDAGSATAPGATLFVEVADGPPPYWVEQSGARTVPVSLLNDDTAARATLSQTGCLLLDASASTFPSVARRVHALDPAVQVVAVATPEATPHARRALLYAPGLGEVWVASPADITGALAERAAGVTRQRRRFDRTRARLEHQRLSESPQRTERALVSDAYLAGLLIVLPDAVFSVDSSGRILSVNTAAERLFGQRVGTVVGDRLSSALQLTPPPAEDIELLTRAAHEEHVEVVFRSADGERLTGELRAARLSVPGRGDVWAVVLRDVTELHQMIADLRDATMELETSNEELEATNEELQSTTEELLERTGAERAGRARIEQLQHLTEGLAASQTIEEVVAVAVPNTVEVTGARAGLLVLRSPAADEARIVGSFGLPDETRTRYERFRIGAQLPTAECIRTGEAVFIESDDALHARFPATRELWAALDTHAVAALPLVAGGETIGAMSFNFRTPRTFEPDDRAFYLSLARQCAQAVERARLFAAEREARAHADEANLAKSQFLATMSHELRTPLNAISGYVQLLDMGIHGPVSEPQRQVLARINAAQAHLLGLINDVLNFAKLESGRVEYDTRTLLVGDVFNEVAPLIAPQFAQRKIAFHMRGPSHTGLSVRADRDKLRQVLLNLLSNAAKFTAAGGEVRLEADQDGADRVAIRVRDTGIGIPADRLESIFEPFVQVRAPYNPSNEGTGLGLSISRDLARGMGGELSAESREGHGSTFTLLLPIG